MLTVVAFVEAQAMVVLFPGQTLSGDAVIETETGIMVGAGVGVTVGPGVDDGVGEGFVQTE